MKRTSFILSISFLCIFLIFINGCAHSTKLSQEETDVYSFIAYEKRRFGFNKRLLRTKINIEKFEDFTIMVLFETIGDKAYSEEALLWYFAPLLKPYLAYPPKNNS